MRLKQIMSLATLRKSADAQVAFNAIPSTAAEREEGYYQLALAHARAKNWSQAKSTVQEMMQKYPNGKLVPKTLIDVGLEVRVRAAITSDEGYYFQTAVSAYPNAIDVAQAAV